MRKAGTHHNRKEKSINRPHKQQLQGADINNIPELTDDILIAIISRLTLREATATSILSHRWRYLHTYATRLHFPTYTPEVEVSSYDDNDLLIKSEERRFRNHVEMIDGVLDSHRGGVEVKELKLHMHRMKGASVEKWMDFAFSKQIQIIHISLKRVTCWALDPICCRYSLGLAKLPLGQLPALKFLIQFSLYGIDMDDQDFDLLISNFVALESLSIGGMHELKKVSIVGHPKLKHVDISVTSLESIEIRDVMNLLCLRFDNLSGGCAVELENIPKLTEFHYCEHGRRSLAHDELFARMSSCIRDQLQLLHLSTPDHFITVSSTLWQLPFEFVNIKHMELEDKQMSTSHPARLYKLKPLIRACPSLQKLKIKFDWWMLKCGAEESIKLGKRKANVYRPCHKKLSTNLKELELEGYVGTDSEFELASYIINCAANLEKAIVVLCDATKDIQQKATARAKSDFRKIASRLHVKFK